MESKKPEKGEKHREKGEKQRVSLDPGVKLEPTLSGSSLPSDARRGSQAAPRPSGSGSREASPSARRGSQESRKSDARSSSPALVSGHRQEDIVERPRTTVDRARGAKGGARTASPKEVGRPNTVAGNLGHSNSISPRASAVSGGGARSSPRGPSNKTAEELLIEAADLKKRMEDMWLKRLKEHPTMQGKVAPTTPGAYGRFGDMSSGGGVNLNVVLRSIEEIGKRSMEHVARVSLRQQQQGLQSGLSLPPVGGLPGLSRPTTNGYMNSSQRAGVISCWNHYLLNEARRQAQRTFDFHGTGGAEGPAFKGGAGSFTKPYNSPLHGGSMEDSMMYGGRSPSGMRAGEGSRKHREFRRRAAQQAKKDAKEAKIKRAKALVEEAKRKERLSAQQTSQEQADEDD